MQHIAADATHALDQGLPLRPGKGPGSSEYRRCPGLMPIAAFGDRSGAAGRLAGGAEGCGLVQQGGLIVLQVDNDLSLRLRLGRGLEGFFGSGWHRG